MPPVACFLQLLLKNVFKWYCLLMLDVIVLIRYLFIFWIKNPAAVQDDYWTR